MNNAGTRSFISPSAARHRAQSRERQRRPTWQDQNQQTNNTTKKPRPTERRLSPSQNETTDARSVEDARDAKKSKPEIR